MATTQVTLNIDNTLIPDAIAAMRWKSGYAAQIDDGTGTGTLIANPETQLQSAKKRLKTLIQNDIADYKAMLAQQAVTPPADSLIS